MPDLDTLVSTTLASLAELFGYEHSLLLLLDEHGERLYTSPATATRARASAPRSGSARASSAWPPTRAEPMRVGNLGQMLAYARTRAARVRGTAVARRPGREIPLPGLADAESQVAVPAMVLGQLVGVVVIESATPRCVRPRRRSAAHRRRHDGRERDRDRLGPRARRGRRRAAASRCAARGRRPRARRRTRVRFFAVDGSTFLDGEYLIKGVAGRILWALLGHYDREGRVEFTNKEVRLDPSLELPEFRDNLESRLILLKRRLDERDAPIRIEKTGRGRFRLLVERELRLECVDGTG